MRSKAVKMTALAATLMLVVGADICGPCQDERASVSLEQEDAAFQVGPSEANLVVYVSEYYTDGLVPGEDYCVYSAWVRDGNCIIPGPELGRVDYEDWEVIQDPCQRSDAPCMWWGKLYKVTFEHLPVPSEGDQFAVLIDIEPTHSADFLIGGPWCLTYEYPLPGE